MHIIISFAYLVESFEVVSIWLLLGVYKPPNQNDTEFLNRIGAILDYYFQKYDNVTIIGDFNITTENTQSKYFDQRTNMFSVKEPQPN